MDVSLRDYFFELKTPLDWARANATWMSKVPDETKLSALSIPGTHNTCARFGGFLTRAAQCQSMTLGDQLAVGIRFLDIRCRHIQDVFAIHHGIVFQNLFFDDVLQGCIEFLRANPSECIILSLQKEYEDAANTRSFADTFKNKYLFPSSGYWYTENRIPAMREVRGKIVLVSRADGIDGIPWSTMNIQDSYSVPNLNAGVAGKWELIRAKLVEANAGLPGTWYINFSSAANQPLISPHQVALIVNERLYRYLSRNVLQRTGTIVMDYPGERLINRIIGMNPAQEIEGRRSVRRNSKIILQNANGKFVTKWYSGTEYYYPQYGDSILEAEPFRLGGDSLPLKADQEVQILTTNTGGMKESWRSYDQLVCFSEGVGYWKYEPDSSKVGNSWWVVESVSQPDKTEPVHFDDAVRLKNVRWKQYLHPYPGTSYLWTKASADDDTKWIIRRSRITIRNQWDPPVDLGGGWSDYKHVFYGGKGIIYALTPKGELHSFRDRGASFPPDQRWAARRVFLGGGFAPLKFAFSGGKGMVYTVDEAGILRYYRDLARDDAARGPRWANGGEGLRIGSDWAGFKTVLSGGNGIIYVIRPNGDLLLYLDQAQDDTTPESKRWALGGAPSKIGSGWGGFVKVFYGGNGVLYVVTSIGELLYYQDGLRAHGSDNRWLVDGTVIGTGWNRYVTDSSIVFGGEDGEVYVVTDGGRLLYFRNRSYDS